jgi:MFS family permease
VQRAADTRATAATQCAPGSEAFRFVLTMGLVNLFADVTYEGGGAINGAFLGSLGASAAAISIVAGGGEFVGYGLRAVSGYVADKTGRHWLITFFGYVVNLLAVPAMALAGSWQVAAALVFAERAGRALRKPTVEAMLSYTTERYGRGWVYAVNTGLDETGATLGPLAVAAVLFYKGSYPLAFALLLLPAFAALGALAAAYLRFPAPAKFASGHAAAVQGFIPSYWLFMGAAACFATGLLSYELISFHLTRTGMASAVAAPLLLAFATGSGVVASLVMGRAYDRFGLPVVLCAVVLSSLFAPLMFFGSLALVIVAMPLLGIGYAVQDTLLKAIVAGVLPAGRRNLAFGLFYAGYGCGWLVGSVAMGLLYARSQLALVLLAALAQLASLPMFVIAQRRMRPTS